MAFSRRTLSLVTVVLVVTLVAGGIYLRLRPDSDGGEAEAAEATGPEADSAVVASAASAFSTEMPQPVEGAPVVRDTLWISVRAAGNAEAIRRAVVKAQVEGVIEAIPVRENQAVQAGQAIVQIDTTELALEVARARSELLDARARYESTLIGDDEIEDEEVRRQREQIARAQSGLNAAEVAVRQAELRLERSTVRAPFQGRVADLLVVPGQHVGAGTDLMTVVDVDPIKVEVQVLEAELGMLREGRLARVTFASYPDEVFVGRIQTINPVVDMEERTGRVTVLLANPGRRIKPGMYAEASLEARSFPDRVLVPRTAILERGDTRRNIVFVYEEENGRGRARWQYVCPGEENETLVELVPPGEPLQPGGQTLCEEGIVEPGQTVLVDGHHYLAHDVPVRLVEDVASAGGRPSR